jgi:glutamine synthetase
MTAKDVLKLAKEKGAKIVDLRFIDLPGLWQHFSIPVSELSEEIFEDGLG